LPLQLQGLLYWADEESPLFAQATIDIDGRLWPWLLSQGACLVIPNKELLGGFRLGSRDNNGNVSHDLLRQFEIFVHAALKGFETAIDGIVPEVND